MSQQETPPETLEGGCACGAIRYRITQIPTDAGFCHCRLCQKTTGAAVLASASLPIDAFAYLRGEPVVYASSAWGERRFCGRCGTQLEYRLIDAPKKVEINYATLDDPSRIRPVWHIWYANRFPGIEIGDDLPKHDDGGEG
ncbi:MULTISPECIES: GFA family protein [Burkholderia]|uniref:Aldehyde-activating protein n=1 Tax=Burkholderia ubonensis TaxID=101571 RepID=A0A106VI33_9BURK|nr:MULTISPECIES: GFA family protein [Burkholderia]AJX16207.1 glutathione-dependent formaldehyde-activating enzyme family protein [Burkholderia ubonensis MSMB22]KIP18361.1 glutathione-dependent formaldehyde-activating enzyme family protein [Burkholderia sp. MSHR3999]KVC81737.1 aldehyde-activating protein [Burkholderia ubonensis]KVC99966.1 aldehyde-activating protein [Burkholderia ubonensis]KVD01993.1 aldehyde-activating protein [Burkholderia ubonensis]